MKQEQREDVVVFELDSRKVTNIVGTNLGETGFYTASKRLETVCARLNEHFDAACVPTGKYKISDVLPEEP
jgi:hypothetical protein